MFVTVNGLKTYYESLGAGEETILLLHGWGAPVGTYRAVLSHLAQRFRVVAFDMPGCGQTQEPPAPLTVDDYAAFALAFCREIGLTRATLLCHSHGGRVGVRLMSDVHSPLCVPRAVLFDAAGVPPHRTAKQKAAARCYKALRVLGTARLTAPLLRETYEAVRDRRSSDDYRMASEVMRRTLSIVVNTDMTPLMPRVTVPVLLLWGERDTATPLSDGQQMARLMPNAALVPVANAGHFPFLDAPQVFYPVLDAFLSDSSAEIAR